MASLGRRNETYHLQDCLAGNLKRWSLWTDSLQILDRPRLGWGGPQAPAPWAAAHGVTQLLAQVNDVPAIRCKVGTTMIPKRRSDCGLSMARWAVERTIRWMQQFRQLPVCNGHRLYIPKRILVDRLNLDDPAQARRGRLVAALAWSWR